MLRKYFRDAGILGITEILLRLKGLVLMPILTRYFGAVNYGIWAQVAVIVSLLGPVVSSGLDSAACRFLPGQDKGYVQRGFASILVYITGLSALVSVALWVLSAPLAGAFFEDAQNARFIALCGGVVFAGQAIHACRNFYRVIGNARAFAVINIVRSVYGSVVPIAVVLLKGSVFEVVLGTLVANLIFVIVLLVAIMAKHGIGRPDRLLLVKFLRYGLVLIPGGYAMWVLNLSDRLFITHYDSLADLGVYSVVYNLGYMLITFFFNPISLMFPTQAAELYNQEDMEGVSRLFFYSSKAALALLVPGMIGLAVLAKPLLLVLTTEEFVRGAPLVSVITLGYVFHMMSSYFDVCLGLANRQVWTTINIIASSALNLLLNWMLIPRWGIAGAAISTAASFGVQMMLSILLGTRYVRLAFDWEFLAKLLGASMVMAAVLWAVAPSPSLLSLLTATVAGVGVLVILMLLLRALSPAEMRALLRAARLGGIVRFKWARVLLGA